jgi:hypothetical protein
MTKQKNSLLQTLVLLGVFTIAGLLDACNKAVTMPDAASSGQISFFFASTALLSGTNVLGSKNYIVLVDTRDTTYQPPVDIFHSIYPIFYHPDANLPTYPRTNSTWAKFMELSAGTHQLFLLDTSRSILDSAQVNLSATTPTMIFYGDKMGAFRHIIANDPYMPADGKIGIRIINLSPMDGSVFLTLNKQIPSTLPAATHFGDHTGFIPVDFSQPGAINIKAYQPGDTTQFLGRTTVDVMPGHAYTLVINGYTDKSPGTYKDPRTGKIISIAPNFSITAIKNF